MTTENLSLRSDKKNSCKSKYPQFFRACREAVRRYRGGFNSLSAMTSVCPSTLSDNINLNRSCSPSSETILDLISAFRGDKHFRDYFIRAFLTDDEPCEKEMSLLQISEAMATVNALNGIND